MYKKSSQSQLHRAGAGEPGFSYATIKLCRRRLEELASHRKNITYAELSEYLGVRMDGLKYCLEKISKECRSAKPPTPDLALLVWYANKPFGCDYSLGRGGRKPWNAKERRFYQDKLDSLYKQFAC